MGPEFKEKERVPSATIEICGTPFAARYKFLVHNAIEDMVSERIGEKIRGAEGFSEFTWPVTVNKKSDFIPEFHGQLVSVQKKLGVDRLGSRLMIMQDGAFTAMVMTEVMKRAMVISKKDAENHLRGLVPYAQMEDLIVLTLVRPRAAMTRELYPQELENYTELMKRKFIFFSVYNEAAETILTKFSSELPKVELIKPVGDNFQCDEIFFSNANAVFQCLGLPTIEEWSKELVANPDIRGRNVKEENLTSSTTAGLTADELRKYLYEKDWSVNQEKRDRVTRISLELIKELSARHII